MKLKGLLYLDVMFFVLLISCTRNASLPTLTTNQPTSITSNTAISGGNIVDDGGEPITARGVVWSNSPNPTIALTTKTNDGTGIGNFVSNVAGLNSNTTYYIRSYATNINGTAYGNEITFSTQRAPDIFIAGFDGGGSHVWRNQASYARLKLNGINASRASCVVLSGNDFYVAGETESNGSVWRYPKATAWKNGVPIFQTSGNTSGRANSMFVSGTDIFIAGYENNANWRVAKYWKNGAEVVLTDGTSHAEATDVAVSGTDVYVTGFVNLPGSNAKLWKNGTPINLQVGQFSTSRASSICISNSDIYVSGFENQTPLIWKNGIQIPLQGTGQAFDVKVNGQDVYAVGNSADFQAIIWKNGAPTILSRGSGQAAFANALHILGSDIYVVGYVQYGNITEPVLWKNGVLSLLPRSSNGNSNVALSIDIR